MKTDDTQNGTGSSKYWLSLEQWRQDPQFQELAAKEFQSSPLIEESQGQAGWARREFLKLMGASLALTTFGCVRRPAQKIIPYIKTPPEVVPGVANYYTSSFADGSLGYGIIVTTREGRPIKVEGNPAHPLNAGGMSARAHAHVLSLYDPDRLTGPKHNLLNEKKTNRETIDTDWPAVDKAVADQLKKGGVALLTGSLLSPATSQLVEDFKRTYSADHFVWEPLDLEAVREGQKASYGQGILPRPRLDKAKLVVSVDCDFLGTYLSPTEFAKDFAKGRRPGPEMNKLVVFESLLSLTGTNADDRYRIKPSEQVTVVMALLQQLVAIKKLSRYAQDSRVLTVLGKFADEIKALEVPVEALSRLADELWKNKGQSLVMAGGVQGQTEAARALQIAVNFLNSVLENDGATIDYKNATYRGFQGGQSQLAELIAKLNAGKVKTLIVYGVNPVYAAPGSSGFAEAYRKSEMAIYVGERMDETALISEYVATDHHPMENWGDSEFQSGVFSIQQPTLRPLYNSRGFQDSLMAWMAQGGKAAAAENWYAYLRNYWQKNIYGGHRLQTGTQSFDGFWDQALQTGVFDTTQKARNSSLAGRGFDLGSLQKITKAEKATEFELSLYVTVGLQDGTLGNVSWLQEFPDPVTKICWDNYLCISPKAATERHLKEGQVVQVQVGANSIEVPVHIQPGQHDGVLGLALGYGRTAAGRVANGVGVDAYKLALSNTQQVVYSGVPCQLKATPKMAELASTQGHHSMEGRQIVVEATLKDYLNEASANIHRHKMFSAWSKHDYPGHKWGMAIDLNTCTGCSACVMACQSENNVPVVGKKYVLKGREMHWIRIDRYYVGSPDEPDVVHMPLTCQHCDNAPCETVCPVIATNHGPEGTNDMIYNRCVGTRYCSNNCPYKVRRFNWFNYVKTVPSPQNLALNPEVTVRSRGVMEKCTFCNHRIKAARDKSRAENRNMVDGDVVVACQQSCPTGAIVFGDMNDPKSKLSQMFKDPRSYSLLEELNAAPASRFQTKIRNTEQLKSSAHGHSKKGGHA